MKKVCFVVCMGVFGLIFVYPKSCPALTQASSTDQATGITTSAAKDDATGQVTVTKTDSDGNVISRGPGSTSGGRPIIRSTDTTTGETTTVTHNPMTGETYTTKTGAGGSVTSNRSEVNRGPLHHDTASSTNPDTGITTSVDRDPFTDRSTVTKRDSDGRVIQQGTREPPDRMEPRELSESDRSDTLREVQDVRSAHQRQESIGEREPEAGHEEGKPAACPDEH